MGMQNLALLFLFPFCCFLLAFSIRSASAMSAPSFVSSGYTTGGASNAQAITRLDDVVFIGFYENSALARVRLDPNGVSSHDSTEMIPLPVSKVYAACADKKNRRIWVGTDEVPGRVVAMSADSPYTVLATLTLVVNATVNERYLSSCVVVEEEDGDGTVLFGTAASPGMILSFRLVPNASSPALWSIHRRSTVEVESRSFHAALYVPSSKFHRCIFVGATSPGSLLTLRSCDPADEDRRVLFRLSADKPRSAVVVGQSRFLLLGFDMSSGALIQKIDITGQFLAAVGSASTPVGKLLSVASMDGDDDEVVMFASMAHSCIVKVNSSSMEAVFFWLPSGVFALRVGIAAGLVNEKVVTEGQQQSKSARAIFGLSQYPASNVPSMQFVVVAFSPAPTTPAPTPRPSNDMERKWVQTGASTAPPGVEYSFNCATTLAEDAVMFSMSVTQSTSSRFRVLRFTQAVMWEPTAVGEFDLPPGMEWVSSISVLSRKYREDTSVTEVILLVALASLPDSQLVKLSVVVPARGSSSSFSWALLQNVTLPQFNWFSAAAAPSIPLYGEIGNVYLTTEAGAVLRLNVSATASIDIREAISDGSNKKDVMDLKINMGAHSAFSSLQSCAIFLASRDPGLVVVVDSSRPSSPFTRTSESVRILSLAFGENKPRSVAVLASHENIVLVGLAMAAAGVVKVELAPVLRRVSALFIPGAAYLNVGISVADSFIVASSTSPAKLYKVKLNPHCADDAAADTLTLADTLTMQAGESYPRAMTSGLKGSASVFSAMVSFGTTPGKVSEIFVGDADSPDRCTATTTTTSSTTTTTTSTSTTSTTTTTTILTPAPPTAVPTTAAPPTPVPPTTASPPTSTNRGDPPQTTSATTTTTTNTTSWVNPLANGAAKEEDPAAAILCILGDSCAISIAVWVAFLLLLLILLLILLKRRGWLSSCPCGRGADARDGLSGGDDSDGDNRDGREIREAFLRVPQMHVVAEPDDVKVGGDDDEMAQL